LIYLFIYYIELFATRATCCKSQQFNLLHS